MCGRKQTTLRDSAAASHGFADVPLLVRVCKPSVMDLFEHTHEERLGREAAAQKLRELADQLSRHNQIEFNEGGLKHVVKVPNEVNFSLEVEVGEDSTEIEVEITW